MTRPQSAKRVPILAAFTLALVSLACSLNPIVAPTPEPVPTSPATEPIPTSPATMEAPAEVVTTPADSATSAPPPPRGAWESIPDLPRNINALIADPVSPHVLYAGTGSSGAGSGVYKSEDAGQTWYLASSGLPSEDVRALAIGRSDPPTLYAAVGNRGDVFASGDGAQSWTRLGNYELTGFKARLAVAPDDPNVLVAVEDVRGVYRSLDGGYSWSSVGEGLPKDENGSTSAQSLAMDPVDAGVIYLGTGWGNFGGNGVFKSTDGGESWSPANRGMLDYGITALGVDPVNPQIVYAGGEGGELFKSTDGGQTWHDLSEGLPDQTRIVEIAIDPQTPDTLFLLCDQMGLLVSHDGGVGWRLLGKPGEIDYDPFSAMVVVHDPQRPVVLVGVERKGGWRHSAD